VKIIWDLDGTLIDSEKSISDCLTVTLAAYGYRSTAAHLVSEGLPLINLVERSIPGNIAKPVVLEIVESFKVNYDSIFCVRAEIFPEINVLLQKHVNQELCIATNKRRLPTTKILEGLFSPYKVGNICCIDDSGITCKVDMIKALVKKNSWESEVVIYIGDNQQDAKCASLAGVESIVVDWRNNDLEYLLDELRARGFAAGV
jgi:phosphoglycolate phosphatase-like HAD superfamily hydrolase